MKMTFIWQSFCVLHNEEAERQFDVLGWHTNNTVWCTLQTVLTAIPSRSNKSIITLSLMKVVILWRWPLIKFSLNYFCVKICSSDRNICIAGNDLINVTKNAIPVLMIDIREFETGKFWWCWWQPTISTIRKEERFVLQVNNVPNASILILRDN